MKSTSKHLMGVISLLAAGLLVAATSHAATQPSSIAKFTPTATDQVLKVKSSSWRDPAFGDMGWTHSSDWGTVWATKGQTITIKAVSVDAGLHPGITVWFRGKEDTAPNTYVVDHFYPQNANFAKFGVTDEGTGAALGNIIMRVVAYGYDQDGNSKKPRMLNGITDNVPGQLELSFKAARTGVHQFVIGGYNPDAGVDTSVKHDINVSVIVTGP